LPSSSGYKSQKTVNFNVHHLVNIKSHSASLCNVVDFALNFVMFVSFVLKYFFYLCLSFRFGEVLQSYKNGTKRRCKYFMFVDHEYFICVNLPELYKDMPKITIRLRYNLQKCFHNKPVRLLQHTKQVYFYGETRLSFNIRLRNVTPYQTVFPESLNRNAHY
jgi:hypothetical protein